VHGGLSDVGRADCITHSQNGQDDQEDGGEAEGFHIYHLPFTNYHLPFMRHRVIPVLAGIRCQRSIRSMDHGFRDDVVKFLEIYTNWDYLCRFLICNNNNNDREL
jgi:hypothetical protein